MYGEFESRLEQIATELRAGGPSPTPTAREFLSWIDAKRRGAWIVSRLRRGLDKHGLITEPDFESAYIDSKISFVLQADETEGTATQIAEGLERDEVAEDAAHLDPTYRLSKLQAANLVPVSVTPGDSLEVATTKMLANDFSQLPVMTSERDVKGVISWRGVGSRLALGRSPGPVRDFMDDHVEVDATTSMFSVINRVAQHDYVLVRGQDRRIMGIVTASDLSVQFRQLTEPFLLLGEIENHIRRLIGDRFGRDELQAACDPNGPERDVECVADLTFGEYVRLLQNPSMWERLGLAIDRAVVVMQLERVREIRNDVMHFDPDGIPDEDLEVLRDMSGFLQTLQTIGAT